MSNFIVSLSGKLKFVFLLFCIALLAVACKKSDNSGILSGTYTGRYLYASGGIVYNHGELLSTFTFNNGSYTSASYSNNPSANSVSMVSSGTYQTKADSVTFSSALIAPGTLQGSTYSLVGTYQYHFEGDSLIITKSYSSGSLNTFNQYRLKKN